MAKKKNDQNFISELLGKLKASYADPKEQNERAAQKDTSDAEFQKQLQAMLNKSTPEKSVAKKESKTATKASKVKKAPALAKASKPASNTASQKAPKQEPIKASKPEKQATEELFLPADLVEEIPTESETQERVIEETIPVMVETFPEVQKESLTEQSSPEIEPITMEEIEAPVMEIAESEIPQSVEQPQAENAEPLPEKAIPFSKQENAPPPPANDTIVIRPKHSSRQQEAIVIRPRTQDKPTLTPHRVEAEPSKEPVKIGRKEESHSVKATTPVKQVRTVQRTPSSPKQVSSAESASALPKKKPEASVASTSTSQPAAAEEKIARQTVREEKTSEVLSSVADQPVFVEPPMPEQSFAPEKPSVPEQPSAPAASFSEQIYQKTGLSDEDLSLLFELGYDGELANLVGTENLKKLKSENLRRNNRREEAQYPTAIGYRGKEYTEKSNRSGVLAAYIHDRNHLIAQLILTSLVALCLLFIDVPALRGARLTQISLNLPLLFPILGILLLISAAALSAKQLWAGAKSLFRFSPSPYSVCGILLIPTLIYDLLAIFLPTLDLPVNFLVALAFLSTLICDVFRLWGELRVFRLVSCEGEKYALELSPLRKKKMKYGDRIVKILNDDIDERFYRIVKAKEATGFFRRFNTSIGNAGTFALLIFAAFVFPLFLSLAVAVYTLSFSSAANAFITFLILCTPLSAVFGVFYPLFHANRVLARHQCALVGSESVEEYSTSKTLILDDSDVFHTEKCTEIVMDESGDFQNDMKLASALFRTVGSTLEHLGQAALQDGEQPTVTLLRILENGVEATVNGQHLLAGDASFLKRYGIRVPKESADRVMRRTENVSVMYVAVNGVLKLNYEIDYTEKLTFEKMAEALSESKTTVAIRSYDPNLNTAFVQQIRDRKKEPLRVIKPGRYESNGVLDLVDSGAISLDSPEKTLCALQAAAKVSKLQSLTARLQLIATLLGGVGACFFKILEGEFFGIPAILFYHLFWIAITVAATHIEITEDKIHLLK